jgi:pectate lyase
MGLLVRHGIPQSGAGGAYSRERLLSKRNGFADTVIGGYLGADYLVTSTADSGAGSLRAALESDSPLWIQFDPSIHGSTITLTTSITCKPEKTIDGMGAGITIANRGISLQMVNATAGHQAAAEFICQGLTFQGIIGSSQDGISIASRLDRPAHNVWVRYCTFTDIHDGLFDMAGTLTNGAVQGATIEWNKFGHSPGAACIAEEGAIDWDNIPDNDGRNGKGTLFGDAASSSQASVFAAAAAPLGITPTELAFRKRFTLHHNLYTGLLQRMPYLRWCRAHLYNNVVDGWGNPYEDGQPKGNATELSLYTDIVIQNSIYDQWPVGFPHPADGTLVTHPATRAIYFDDAYLAVAYMKLQHSGIVHKAGTTIRDPHNASSGFVVPYAYDLDATTEGTNLADAANVALKAKVVAGAGAR